MIKSFILNAGDFDYAKKAKEIGRMRREIMYLRSRGHKTGWGLKFYGGGVMSNNGDGTISVSAGVGHV